MKIATTDRFSPGLQPNQPPDDPGTAGEEYPRVLGTGRNKLVLQRKPKLMEYSVQDLYDLYSQDPSKIDLEPAYQRGVVWSKTKQSSLIESIMGQRGIFPLVFNKKTTPSPSGEQESDEIRTCMDGKQRLVSIFNFLDGKFPIRLSASNRRNIYYSHPTIDGIVVPHKSRSILPELHKDHFRSCLLVVMEHENLNAEEEIFAFQLLQGGTQLTSAEVTNSVKSDRADFCKKLVIDYKIMREIFKGDRKNDFKMIAILFSALDNYPADDSDKIPTMRQKESLNNFLSEELNVDEEEKERIKTVLDRFKDLVICDPPFTSDKNKTPRPTSVFSSKACYFKATLGKAETFSPIEFFCTAILLFHYPDRNGDLLLADIKSMRKYIRQEHRDLRLNNGVLKTAWKFIKDEMKKRLQGDFSGDIGDGEDEGDDEEGADGDDDEEDDDEEGDYAGDGDEGDDDEGDDNDSQMTTTLDQAEAGLNGQVPKQSLAASLTSRMQELTIINETDCSLPDYIREEDVSGVTREDLSLGDQDMGDVSALTLDASFNSMDLSSGSLFRPKYVDRSARGPVSGSSDPQTDDISMRDRSSGSVLHWSETHDPMDESTMRAAHSQVDDPMNYPSSMSLDSRAVDHPMNDPSSASPSLQTEVDDTTNNSTLRAGKDDRDLVMKDPSASPSLHTEADDTADDSTLRAGKDDSGSNLKNPSAESPNHQTEVDISVNSTTTDTTSIYIPDESSDESSDEDTTIGSGSSTL